MATLASSKLYIGDQTAAALYIGATKVWEKSTSFSFAPLTINGGGWVTGLDTQGDHMYARTDVGGAYRYEQSTNEWIQMVTTESVAIDRRETDYQVEALACAPSNPDVVYMAVGGGDGGRILASIDAGATWPVSSPRSFYVAGNENHRFAGTRLAVDISNPQIAYFGSRRDGLYRTTDGGATWAKIASLPVAIGDSSTTNAVGVTCVVVDRESPVVNGYHQHIWASVFGVGLVESTDAGGSWTTVSAWTGTGAYVSDIVQDANGDLIATFWSPAADSSEIRKISRTNVVTNIDPKSSGWRTVAVDPSNPQNIYALSSTLSIWHNSYRTVDGGQAWTPIRDFSFSGSDADWLVDTVMPASQPYVTGQVRYFNGDLYFAEGHGIWRATEVAGEHVTWESANKGVEELVSMAVIKPAGKPALSLHYDYALLRHPITTPAYLPYITTFNSGFHINVSPTDPSFLVAVLDDHQDAWGLTNPGRRQSGYSTDGGETWTRFGALQAGTAPADLRHGVIAVSADNNDNIVWVPSNKTGLNTKAYYTTDRGTTWTQATLTGLTADETIHPLFLYSRHNLIADPLTPETFWMLGSSTINGAAIIWKSTDSGATWAKQTTTGIGGNYWTNATFTHDGTAFWLVPGDGEWSGIWRSTDGTNWTAKPTIVGARRLGVGVPMPGSGNPTLFTFGSVGGVPGMYLSRDNADTWEKLSDYPLGNYAGIRQIAGDPDVPGKVYVALGGGTGLVVGQYS